MLPNRIHLKRQIYQLIGMLHWYVRYFDSINFIRRHFNIAIRR